MEVDCIHIDIFPWPSFSLACIAYTVCPLAPSEMRDGYWIIDALNLGHTV